METGLQMAAGRPTLYKPEYCDEIVAYFDVEPTREVQKTVFKKDGSIDVVETQEPVPLPTLAGFACKIKVCKDTLNEWSKVHPEFSAAIKKCKVHQERILLANGLDGGYNTAVAIFALKNLADWKDKVQQEVTGDIQTTLNIKFIDPNG